MYINIHNSSPFRFVQYFLSRFTHTFSSNTNFILNKLENILDSSRIKIHRKNDSFDDTTSLFLLKFKSTELLNEINQLKSIDKDTRSAIGKTALSLLHCYSNNGYLDTNFACILMDNIYLRGCSSRALLVIIESLQKSNLCYDKIFTIINRFIANQKLLVNLAAQDTCQLLWRFISIHDIYPYYCSNKYYYIIGTLVMHCRKKIQHCLSSKFESRIAWSPLGGNRALQDFSMAIKLFSHATMNNNHSYKVFNYSTIADNLNMLYLSQLKAIDELLKIQLKDQIRHTNISDTAKKVIICLEELFQSGVVSLILGNSVKIYYESPVIGTRYSIDILIDKNQ